MRKSTFELIKNFRIFTLYLCFALILTGGGLGIALYPKDEIQIFKVTVDGYNTADYTKEELIALLKENYKWNFTAEGQGIYVAPEDAISPVIEATVEDAYDTTFGALFEIKLSEEKIEEIAESVRAQSIAAAEAMNSEEHSLMEYDPEKDDFVFNDVVKAPVIDEETLVGLIKTVLEEKRFDTTVEIPFLKDAEVIPASDYKLIGTYTTKAKKNANRDVNIGIACEVFNGLIVEPGQTVSYNETLGPRTRAKGYKEAGVYLNGEHTTGIGGGICQLSSTLYNAIFAANIHVDNRQGHTFEPSYVTPGMDATVSYPNPDFVFTNDSGNPIGIRAHFVDQYVTVEIYGVPTLEEGVSRYMSANYYCALSAPATVYQDNNTLGYGQEVVVSAGKAGSKWATYEVLEKDGEILSKEFLYYTSYKGEAAVVQRNFLLNP